MFTACWSGCTPSSGLGEPQPLTRVGTYSDIEASANADSLIPKNRTSWWKSFDDRALNRLVAAGLENNFDLRQLAARVLQADAELRKAKGQLFPTLDAVGSANRRWIDSDSGDPTNSDGSVSLGALLNWEIDVWGRLRSAVDDRRFEQQATIADWQGARLILSAAISELYFEILEQEQQLRLIRSQIDTGETLLDLTELRFGQAQSSIVDVLQQREQLAATRALTPVIEARLRQLELALDALLARAPGTGKQIKFRTLTPPPKGLSTGVPSDLLKNRPDLLATHLRLASIDAQIAEAIADRLPRFTIGVSGTAVGSSGIDDLIANAFAGVAAPVFDAGVRKAEVDRRRAIYDETLNSYSQNYLTAVRDVETALVKERKQGERIVLLERQLTIAQRLLKETRNRYSQGLTDYLPVLAAVTTEQDLQRELVTSRRLWLSHRIALHRALGGPVSDRDGRPTTPSKP
ncbi:MAG: efflux transporter outer membrane subunit [Verrucomicrobiales bacterium]